MREAIAQLENVCAVGCTVLHRVAVRCSASDERGYSTVREGVCIVLHFVALCCRASIQGGHNTIFLLQGVHCAAWCCTVSQCHSALQCVALRCSVLHCNTLQRTWSWLYIDNYHIWYHWSTYTYIYVHIHKLIHIHIHIHIGLCCCWSHWCRCSS